MNEPEAPRGRRVPTPAQLRSPTYILPRATLTLPPRTPRKGGYPTGDALAYVRSLRGR